MAEDTGTGHGGGAGGEGSGSQGTGAGAQAPTIEEFNTLKSSMESLTAKIAEKDAIITTKDAALTKVTAESISRKNEREALKLQLAKKQGDNDGNADAEAEFNKRLKSANDKHAEEFKKATDMIAGLNNTVRSDRIHSNVIRLGIKHNAYNPEDLAKLLRDDIALDDNLNPYVIDHVNGGAKLIGSEKISVDDFVKTYLTERPHMVKSNNQQGAGSGTQGGAGANSAEGIKSMSQDQYNKNRGSILAGVKNYQASGK